MPTRRVFCVSGQKQLGSGSNKTIEYSIDDPPTTFDMVNIQDDTVTKQFYTIRFNSILSQWIAVGNLGGPPPTSPFYYSNDAYNWNSTSYSLAGGILVCADYGTIRGNPSTKGWLCYGHGSTSNTDPSTYTNLGVTGTNASGVLTTTIPGTIDLSGVYNSKLRSNGDTIWLLSYTDINTVSNIYSIDTSLSISQNTSLYTYDNTVKTNIDNSVSGITGYTGIEYSSKNPGTDVTWAVCGLIGPSTPVPGKGYICMTTNTDPNSNTWGSIRTPYITTNSGTLNKLFNSIVTDNNGKWVAVGGFLDTDPFATLKNGAIIAYSIDDGVSWTETQINNIDPLQDVATDGNGNWTAVGSVTIINPGTPPVTTTTGRIYTSTTIALGTWTMSTVNSNIFEQFTSVDAGVDDVPCFLKGTFIRTPTGEVPIESLKEGDEVVTTTGEVKAITHIQRATVLPTESTCPYKVPAGDLGATQDLYLSPTHGVRTSGGETVEAQFLGYPQEKMDIPVEYYNISIGRLRSELIYANGVAVESMGADGKNTVADVSTFSQERIFTEEVRSDLIDKLNKKIKISYDKLVSYPDSYLQELLSR